MYAMQQYATHMFGYPPLLEEVSSLTQARTGRILCARFFIV